MAVTFTQEKKKQKNLIYVFGAVILITLTVLWLGFFRQPAGKTEQVSPFSGNLKNTEIDFNVLENPLLKELQAFKQISPFEGTTTRENPFLPYK